MMEQQSGESVVSTPDIQQLLRAQQQQQQQQMLQQQQQSYSQILLQQHQVHSQQMENYNQQMNMYLNMPQSQMPFNLPRGLVQIHPSFSFPMYNLDLAGTGNSNVRKGKWLPEEEAYTNKVIESFHAGSLMLPGMEGITLRAYLANKLNCDPMRITKKFTGAQCLGKRVYHGTYFFISS